MESQPSSNAAPAYLEAASATWPEVEAFLKGCPAAILPLGATEQHGPHLPLATDTILATEVAARVARATAGLVLPALPVGYSWVWRDFPGTLSVRFETFEAILRDVAASLARYGTKALLCVTAHGANSDPIKYAVRDLADPLESKSSESHMHILYVAYPGLDAAVEGDLDAPRWRDDTFHACEIETSLLLSVRPELCHMDRAVAEYPPVPPEYRHSALGMGGMGESGVYGDATVATAEKGARWLDATVREIAQLWDGFLRERIGWVGSEPKA